MAQNFQIAPEHVISCSECNASCSDTKLTTCSRCQIVHWCETCQPSKKSNVLCIKCTRRNSLEYLNIRPVRRHAIYK